MSRSPVFCDGFTVTTPKERFPEVFADLRPMLDDLGCTLLNDGYYATPDGAGMKYGNRGGITWLQAKGRFVAALRGRHMLNEFLSSFALGPHRVSSCDLTVDEFVDSPATRIEGVYALAHSGAISFSRKALKHSQIQRIVGPTLYDDTGLDTGTVYLGLRSAEVRGRVYDKTQERAKDGECIGLTVRHELTVTGKMGVSLKDIANPGPCFYHFWPSELLSTPKVDPWVAGGEGYVIERRERLPAQRLKQRVELSTDLGELISLAQSCGPEGMRLLHRLIDERASKDCQTLGSS